MLKRTMAILISAMLISSLAACSGTANDEVKDMISGGSASVETAADGNAANGTELNESSSDDSGSQNDSSQTSTASESSTVSGSSGKKSSKGSKTDTSTESEASTDITTDNSSTDSVTTDNGTTDETVTEIVTTTNEAAEETDINDSDSDEDETVTAVYTSDSSGIIDTGDLFTNRDLKQTADTSSAKTITVSDGQTINITEEGVYVITGSASDCTIKVEASKDAKVQLVLDGVSITNSSTPAIYVVSADKCFVTTTSTENTLSVTGTFTADGTTNTDAVIFSKDDLVFNGTGVLNIVSSQGNGISGKDDIKITGGTYNITSALDSIEANDSIAICDGNFTINSSKDGLHSENDEDDTVGWIYIYGGTFNISASSDGIRGTTYTQIDGGTINISSSEGIESTYIQINGGSVNVSATDDGINASQKSSSIGTPVFEIKAGSLTVTMSGNDVDCIDSNGNIIVSGGTISVSYPTQGPSESFDCDGTSTYTGGTIIINGTQVDSIPQSMMGGMGGMGNMGGMGGRGRW